MDPRSHDLRVLCELLSPRTLLRAVVALELGRSVVLVSRTQSILALAAPALARLARSALLGLPREHKSLRNAAEREAKRHEAEATRLQDASKKAVEEAGDLEKAACLAQLAEAAEARAAASWARARVAQGETETALAAAGTETAADHVVVPQLTLAQVRTFRRARA